MLNLNLYNKYIGRLPACCDLHYNQLQSENIRYFKTSLYPPIVYPNNNNNVVFLSVLNSEFELKHKR